MAFRRLVKRAEFLRAAKGRKGVAKTVVVQARPSGRGDIGLGFTASRKVGGAVARNRAKRRLREAARIVLPDRACTGVDYVLIARAATVDAPWARLLHDLETALMRADRQPAPRDEKGSA